MNDLLTLGLGSQYDNMGIPSSPFIPGSDVCDVKIDCGGAKPYISTEKYSLSTLKKERKRMSRRPCERCGDGGEDETFGIENDKPDAMCGEIHISNNVITWLCFSCRKEWFKELGQLELAAEFEESMLALEFWKARVYYDSNRKEIEEGITLQRRVRQLESEINEFANQWLIT